jgi:uncharacterized membrane protein SpoIIM required for sporulation
LREALFIKKNKDRWERVTHMPSDDPDEMAKDFTQLVDDLAYAKTFYPNGKVTKFINTRAAAIYLGIYKNRKEENNRLVTFWKYDLPLTMRKHHGTMLFAFLLFAVFFAVGFFLAKQDESIVRQVLGDGYVDLTQDNIDKGNPFGIYQSGNAVLTWLGIMVNNIIVSLQYFVKGILVGIPTVISLIGEAIRIGAFEQFFFSRGLGLQSILTVFIHGTLEITAIIIAGGAGIVLGKSILFPGTVKRIDSVRTAAKDGVKIVIGLLPVFIVAAFFEGMVTRHYTMHWIFSGSILLASAGFIIWYFVVYPILLQKKLSVQLNHEEA